MRYGGKISEKVANWGGFSAYEPALMLGDISVNAKNKRFLQMKFA